MSHTEDPVTFDGHFHKIALEEHYNRRGAPGSEDLATVAAKVGLELKYLERMERQLEEIGAERLAVMDRAGIDHAVLSLTSPGVEAIVDSAEATTFARESNDILADAIADAPAGRFSGFATLDVRDAEHAAEELARCVRIHGFRGALINGYSDTDDGPLYLDEDSCDALWAAAEDLDVPIYLHPRSPVDETAAYSDHPELRGATWGFSPETATHALRIMTAGVFDRHPGAKLILGHLGEGLSHTLSRTQFYFEQNPFGRSMEKSMTECMAENVWVTTSGIFDGQALLGALLRFGADRILFSVDFPYADSDTASAWYETVPISLGDQRKIAWSNAARLLSI